MAGGVVAGAALAAGCASRGRGNWDFLNDGQAHTLAAICDQIIPADDFPSASQAGAVTYIDRQLARHYRRHREAYRAGLEQAELLSRKLAGVSLPQAPPKGQFDVVTALEKEQPAFFALVRSHTFESFYGNPRHGGNRDAVSWRMLGLDEPPVRGRAQYDFTKGAQS
jgi:gluconate 2-dehydrogenase gamma chain